MKIAKEVVAMMAALLNRAEAYYFAAMTTAGPTCGPDPLSACSTSPTGADGGDITTIATIACGDSVNGDTSSAPAVGNNGLMNCGDSGTIDGTKGVWYLFEDNASTFCSVTFETCTAASFETRIQVWDDAGCTGSNPACVDGINNNCGLTGASVTIASNPARRYYVYFGGFGAESGSFTLDVTCTAE